MEVTVIGGGITGMTSAYYLSERDGVEVTLLEQGKNIGHGSTPRAAGGIRTLYSTPIHIGLSLESIDVWSSFEADHGLKVDYQNNGYLYCVSNRTQYETLRADVHVQNQMGANTELLSAEEAAQLVPELNTNRFLAAAHDPQASLVDPHAALQAYAQLARENGVNVQTKSKVTDLLQDGNGRIVGVEINNGEKTIRSDKVVNAAGPWGHRIAAMAGVDIPIYPKKRRAAILEPSIKIPDDSPLVKDLESSTFFRPWDGDTVMAGGHFVGEDPDVDPDDSNSYEDKIDYEWAERLMDALMDSAGYFTLDTSIVNAWSGVYAITASNHPIIEESVPGLVNDVGHSGRAFMHAPATGKLVAEIAVDGQATLLDTTALQTDDRKDQRGQLPIPQRQDMLSS